MHRPPLARRSRRRTALACPTDSSARPAAMLRSPGLRRRESWPACRRSSCPPGFRWRGRAAPLQFRADRLADCLARVRFATVAAEQQPAAATTARSAAFQADTTRIHRPDEAFVFDIARHLATRQAGQLDPADPNPWWRRFGVHGRRVGLGLIEPCGHGHHLHERWPRSNWRLTFSYW